MALIPTFVKNELTDFIQVFPTKHKGNFNTSSDSSKLAHKGEEQV
jgi:hypothetical protein